MTNEKAALSSQKTLNKQDEVIGTTACPTLMMMAPLIGLQLTQLLLASLSPAISLTTQDALLSHDVSFP